jgi:hypothetical protein
MRETALSGLTRKYEVAPSHETRGGPLGIDVVNRGDHPHSDVVRGVSPLY